MKKSNFLKIVMTFAFAMIMFGASAQMWQDSTVVGDEIDTVTVNTTVPYYVQPDTYFNPGFGSIGDTATVNSTFTWDFSRFADAPTPGWQSNTQAGGDNAGNYIEVTFNATNGVDEFIYVTETSLTGSCPGTPVSLEVRVIAAPTVTLATDNDGGGILGYDRVGGLTFCEGDLRLADGVYATLTNGMAGNSPSYDLQYTLDVDTLNVGTATWGNVAGSSSDFTGVNYVDGIDVNSYPLIKPADPYDCEVIGGTTYATRYVYTIVSVNDRISRKGDYLAGSAQYYPATGTATMTIIVNPAPVTGPIYHISNMWAN